MASTGGALMQLATNDMGGMTQVLYGYQPYYPYYYPYQPYRHYRRHHNWARGWAW